MQKIIIFGLCIIVLLVGCVADCFPEHKYKLYNQQEQLIDTCEYKDCGWASCSYYGCTKYDKIDGKGILEKNIQIKSCK